MRSKLRSLLAQLPNLLPAVALVWQAARRWTLAWGALLIVQGLLPVATVYLTREVVNSLEAALAGRDTAVIFTALQWVGLMALVMLLNEGLKGVVNWVQTAQAELVSDHIKGRIHAQALALNLSYFETPAFYDMLHRARIDAASRPLSLVQNLGSLLQNSLTLVAMVGVLIPFGLGLPLALLVSTLPAFVVVLRYQRRLHRWQMSRTGATRRANYYDYLLTDRESAPEVRLFGLGAHFKEAYEIERRTMREERVALAGEQGRAELVAGALGLLTMGAALAWATWQTAVRGGALGDLALFYQAFSQGQRLMRTLLSSVGQIYSNLLFVENLFDFLALEPRLPEPQAPGPATLRLHDGFTLRDITFRYPGSERPALRHFSLDIPAGRIIAIVGENGAGKSTLVKLLTRLYDPETGHITLDGRDVRDLPLAELRRLFTILFQVPIRYHLSAADNIAVGDLPAAPDEGAVYDAAVAAGADAPIEKLPDGYETILGKWFGGAELSVGEWQRVALARAFLRQAEVIILDEPTSAMDSWAEAAWLDRFRALAAGRTALIITHRFTTAMQADIIHVMVEGRVVESGSHEALLALDGRYAQSWQQQMREPMPAQVTMGFM